MTGHARDEAVCPACHAARSRPAVALDGHAFRRCDECRSLWLESAPDRERIESLYAGERYYVNPDFGPPAAGEFHGYRDYLADRPYIEAKFDAILAQVERHVEPGRLVDVGAGPGFLVAAARARGWDAIGLDLNPWAVEAAREIGVEVRRGTLEQAGLEPVSVDAVTMMDLVEHVHDADALVAAAARATRPGGALCLLTPDAGSVVSRLLGRRWPELQRPPEHVLLFSVAGAARLLARHGYRAIAWHSVGKTTSARTLLADVAPAAPKLAARLEPWLRESSLGGRELTVDPRTKFVLYALRAHPGASADPRTPVRIPAPRRGGRSTEDAVLDELRELARARRLCDWMFEQFADRVRGQVVEIGAGIGTFSARLLAAGAERLLLVEPQPDCRGELERRFGGDARVRIAAEGLPGSASVGALAGRCDLVLCQNVLEHVGDDAGAVAAMARALRPGGELAVLVPALPRLFGTLDLAYGHWRRYSPGQLSALIAATGLELTEMRYFNLPGTLGWWVKGRRGSPGIGRLSLAAFDALVPVARALERRWRPPLGLSLIAHARRPD